MRSTVYFADLRATTKESFIDKIGRMVDTAGLSDCFKKRDLVAVKLHFGELGNTAFIRPVFLGKIVDHIRKQVREHASDNVESILDATANDPVDSSFNDKGDWRIRPSKWAIDPMKLYEQKEFMNILYQCLAELPERQAEAFMMREIDGLSTDEICKLLNISATNSWVMLYRARMWLRRCLENSWLNTEH